MRIIYYEETDSAVIVPRKPGADTVGEIAGEDLPDPVPGGVVLHRDDASELYGIEIYSWAAGRSSKVLLTAGECSRKTGEMDILLDAPQDFGNVCLPCGNQGKRGGP